MKAALLTSICILMFIAFSFQEHVRGPGFVKEFKVENPINISNPKTGQRLCFAFPFNHFIHIRANQLVYMDSLVKRIVALDSFKFTLKVHTDCRASNLYNLRYSQRIADSLAINMVQISKGMLQIKGIGKGESQLINNCFCEVDSIVPCPESKHLENRRIELVIVGKK